MALEKDQIPPPYRVHNPFIEGVTNSKIVTNVKAGKSCMNWVVCDPKVEFINTKTGKTIDEKLSRLCKFNLFSQFVNVFSLFTGVKLSSLSLISCQAFKEKAVQYQEIKKNVFEFLEKNGRGKWLRKPKELNFFFLKNDISSILS